VELPETALTLLQERPTYAVASAGKHPWVATMYFYLDAAGDLVSAIKSDSITLAALSTNSELAFAVNGANPDVFIQGLGAGEDAGWLADLPEVRRGLIDKSPEIQRFLDNVPQLRVLKIHPTAIYLTDHRQKISPRHKV